MAIATVSCNLLKLSASYEYRLPPLPGDGGTEFFSMTCFENIKKLVKNERRSFGYKGLELNGEKLFPENVRTFSQSSTRINREL